MRRRVLIVLFLLWCAGAESADLVLNWAVPLKKEFASIRKREFSGVVCYDGMVFALLRDGRIMVFDRAGRKVRERRFTGQFVVPPVVLEGGILVGESQIVRLLAPDLSDRWVLAGKSPLVAPPLLRPEGLYLQFVENTVYLVDPATGTLRANYTFYGEEPISYSFLSAPVSVGEKVAVGFSNGQIIFFLHRIAGTVEEILPYNTYQTGNGQISFGDKRQFFDLFALMWDEREMLFFSNGEKSGILNAADGRITPFDKHLRNVRFAPLAGSDMVVAYGEGGVWLIGKDGNMAREVLRSDSFVTGYTPADDYVLFTESGGAVSLYDKALSRRLVVVPVPLGISGGAAWDGRSFYFLSDMGVLYSFGVMETQKVQKILAKEMKAGNNSAVLSKE